ncbi:MAG: chemotaxis protein CheB, partial [Mesorhizobium sp.]
LLRSHQQRAGFARRMAERERTMDRSELAAEFGRRAMEYEADAALIGSILESRRVQVTGNGSVDEESKHEEGEG